MIHLIRHGETEGNAARVFQWPDTPLSARGHEQARALGERFRDEAVAAVLCSDYRRAQETARAIAASTGAPLRSEALLRERNFGALRGTRYADLDVDPFSPTYEPPEGESWQRFHARVDSAFAALLAFADELDGPLAVVTHGLVCHSVVERLLDGDAAVAGFANTAVTSFDRSPPHRLVRVACTAHLDRVEEVAPA